MSVLGGAKSVISTVGAAAGAINGLSPKGFYSTADFYNFIKKPDNVPTSHPLFTVVPLPANITDKLGQEYPISKTLFTNEMLAKFALCIQNIQLPELSLATGSQFGSDVVSDTPQGWFLSMANSPPNWTSNKSVTINILDTHDPIIERFIYPWFIYCLRTNDRKFSEEKQLGNVLNSAYGIREAVKDSISGAVKSMLGRSSAKKKVSVNEAPHTFPRMDIIIKFYRPDEVVGMSEFMNPNFIYKISGAYPIKITLVKPQSRGPEVSAADLLRPVTFAFNSISCIPDAAWEMKHYGNNQHFPFLRTFTCKNAQSGSKYGFWSCWTGNKY